MAKYEIEVWDKTGGKLADIRPICQNLQWSRTRNDAETLSFEINQYLYNRLVNALGYKNNPLSFMEAGRTDLRVKRNGQYLFGANLISIAYSGDTNTVKKTINATGYLNYFSKRYFTGSYTNQYQEDILWDVIEQVESVDNGDYGVRLGNVIGGNQVRRDRTYSEKEVKSLFQQMSEVINGPDFEFTADKKLNIYAAQGVYRPSLRLAYPGDIAGFSWTRSVENIANQVIGKGSGNGDDAVSATATDNEGAGYCYLRQKIATYNSVEQETTLQQNINAVVAQGSMPFEVPSLTIQNDVLDLNQLGVGDTVMVDMSGAGDAELARINGPYRIEQISCAVDSNDSESVTLTFDDYNIDEIISQQQPEDTGGEI